MNTENVSKGNSTQKKKKQTAKHKMGQVCLGIMSTEMCSTNYMNTSSLVFDNKVAKQTVQQHYLLVV